MTTPVTSSTRGRVLSGMRPTGKLHLGNYMGALYNWVRLQDEYECYFFIADWHALTTDYANPGNVKQKSLEVAVDFLSAGLDSEKCVIFRQSHVPEHASLHLLFGMFTPLSWLERVPTYKDQQEQLREKDLATYGFLGYPLLQAADILLYKPNFVPVGQDQVAHVELTREVARRFNQLYDSRWSEAIAQAESDKEKIKAEVSQNNLIELTFPEPQALLTPSPKLPGTDGRKMSKSYGNTIMLSDTETEIRAKLKPMVTDPARIRRTDPGNPEICPVGDLHKVFSSEQTRVEVWQGCTTAGIGCIQCKTWLADAVVTELAPMQERRAKYEANPKLVEEILEAGAARAHAKAAPSMRDALVALGME